MDITGLLLAWRQGAAGAEEQLVPAVYDELHRQAERFMRRESTGHSLQATALVNEAYLRLVDQKRASWIRSAWSGRTAPTSSASRPT
jgi:RNA polymerase sigma-70 factor, ECF subfamily